MKREQADGYDVYLGIDVGKTSHFARAITRVGERELICRAVAQDEGDLMSMFTEASDAGRVLAIVDQRGGFGSLVVACARSSGVDVATIPPSRFSKIAATYGEEKTDRLDALILARAPISCANLVALVSADASDIEEARVLAQYRADAIAERTRAYNRVHDALTRIAPALEDLLSDQALHSSCALAVLSHYGVAGLRKASEKGIRAQVGRQKGFGRHACDLACAMADAARRAEAILPGTGALDLIVKADAARIIELERLDAELSARIEALCLGIPEVEIARSMAGIGKVYSRTIVFEIGDISRFRSASALATYAGLGKCPRESGKMVGRRRRKCFNHKLRTAIIESAKIAIRRPGPDRDYYEKKLAGNKNRKQALHALARKRVTILFAMLKNMTPYQEA